MKEVTLTANEVARIAYAISDRELPRAVAETIVAATLRLDPEAGLSGIPDPSRLHKFTTCAKQRDPFPAMIELGIRGWLIEDEDGTPRLAWAHEMEIIKQMREEAKTAHKMQKTINKAVGKRPKIVREDTILHTEGNRDNV